MWLTGRLAPDHRTIADFRKGRTHKSDSERVRDVRFALKATKLLRGSEMTRSANSRHH
jgi:hypothetical protein